MKEKVFFYLTVTLLIGGGVWGAWLISDQPTIESFDTASVPVENQLTTPITTDSNNSEQTTKITSNRSIPTLSDILALIASGHSSEATKIANTHYSEFSSNDLAQIKDAFLLATKEKMRNTDYLAAHQLVKNGTLVIDDVELWSTLAAVSIKLEFWVGALDAQLRSVALEVDPQSFERKLVSLLFIATQLHSDYEKTDDEVSINRLYQRLSQAHPSYARFQLELARSHLRLNKPIAATTLFEQLQYDSELGNVAKRELAALAQIQESEQSSTPSAVAQKPSSNRVSDIVVPLRRVGNSFIVNTSVNGRSLPLLLDTGASITALSSDLIRRLRLEPTGRSIQLSTANGVTRSNLYRADKIKLGGLTVEGLVVAEIELGRGSGFQGLLGTDLLNSTNSRYSYLIDNQQNSLIFRRR